MNRAPNADGGEPLPPSAERLAELWRGRDAGATSVRPVRLAA